MQPYLHPDRLFSNFIKGETRFWTCVRTRPRWEKRFARWLKARRDSHFLPVIPVETYSGRKSRITLQPLFPGYVFLPQNYSKEMLLESGCVTYVLKPRSSVERDKLDSHIINVWRILVDGTHPAMETNYEVGEKVKVLSGALTGIVGEIVHRNSRRLSIWVDMLGVGVSVVLSPDVVFIRCRD